MTDLIDLIIQHRVGRFAKIRLRMKNSNIICHCASLDPLPNAYSPHIKIFIKILFIKLQCTYRFNFLLLQDEVVCSKFALKGINIVRRLSTVLYIFAHQLWI